MAEPRFKIKNKFQKDPEKKKETWRDVLSDAILEDVCVRLTGHKTFTVDFDDDGYNKGRLAELDYAGRKYFISFSEPNTKDARNSCFQSLSTALNTWAIECNGKGALYFYLLPSKGNQETPYFRFMFRLAKTIGVVFLNADGLFKTEIKAFNSVDDLVRARNESRKKNAGNNSSFVTTGPDGALQVYAKTYGANKGVAELLGMAAAKLTAGAVELFHIPEGNLKRLSKPSRRALEIIGEGRIQFVESDLTLEKKDFETGGDDLRSPRFTCNLLALRGPKKCVLCDCDIPQLIQGAHVWDIASIRKMTSLSTEKKLECALDGENGLWLCENHHKMFDSGVIGFDTGGTVVPKDGLSGSQRNFIDTTTLHPRLPAEILTAKFKSYLEKRRADPSRGSSRAGKG